jgi:carbamoyl-phosphate synthase large subunit
MLGKSLSSQGYQPGLAKKMPLVAIKAPVFSMSKLAGVDSYLGPEMKSTGEVMGVDSTFERALAKALIAAGLMLPAKGGVLLSIADRDKQDAQPLIRSLAEGGYDLYATEGTAALVQSMGLRAHMTTKKLSEGHPNVVDVIRDGSVHAVVNTISGGAIGTTTTQSGQALRDGFHIRRAAVERRIPCFTSLDTAVVAVQASVSANKDYSIRPLREYLVAGQK